MPELTDDLFEQCTTPTILLVDDDESTLDVTCTFLESEGEYRFLKSQNGNDALEIANKELPDLAIVDVSIPGIDGLTLCGAFKNSPKLKAMPVILMTAFSRSGSRVDDRIQGLDSGADEYLVKPVDLHLLGAHVRALLRTRSLQKQLLSTESEKLRALREVIHIMAEKEKVLLGAVEIAVNLLEAKDVYTSGHGKRVASMATVLGRAMGLDSRLVSELRVAAQLHDIGKVGVHERILLKPGTLTDEERDNIREHPIMGARMVEPLNEFFNLAEPILHHHERWDGGGYPDGISGTEIPLAARIISVVDTYDALTSERAYRHARTQQQAVDEIDSQRWKQFDGDVVDMFLKHVHRKTLSPQLA